MFAFSNQLLVKKDGFRLTKPSLLIADSRLPTATLKWHLNQPRISAIPLTTFPSNPTKTREIDPAQ